MIAGSYKIWPHEMWANALTTMLRCSPINLPIIQFKNHFNITGKLVLNTFRKLFFQIFVESSRHVLAWGLSEMWLLWLQTWRSRFYTLHKRKPDPLQTRLPKVRSINRVTQLGGGEGVGGSVTPGHRAKGIKHYRGEEGVRISQNVVK